MTSASAADLFRRLTILVVEDSTEMRHLVVALLQNMGIRKIYEAHDGQSGLDAFARHAPDLVITDGAMAPMNGYEMTRRIRNADDPANANPTVPILMISGHLGQETVDQARDHGVTDYLGKPLTAELLYERVLAAMTEESSILVSGSYIGPSPKRTLAVRKVEDEIDDELSTKTTTSHH